MMAKNISDSLENERSSSHLLASGAVVAEGGNHDSVLDDSKASAPKAGPTSCTDDTDSTMKTEPTAAAHVLATSISTSSAHTSRESLAGNVSPYGTRSRNRSAGSRPNYAEDPEMDLEFEVQPSTASEVRHDVYHVDSQATMATCPTATSTSRRAPGDALLPAQHPVKETIPGTSTFFVNTAALAPVQQSKKRKATAQSSNSTPSTQPITNVTSTASQTMIRKPNSSMQAAASIRGSSMLSFENCASHLRDGKLVADDGTTLHLNDHVYLVCEPPGEPYYLGRIMEFLHVDNDPNASVDALRMNWYYRPKDIGRKTSDHRQVFASMHSDISPLTALRGICQIKHKSEVQNFEDFRKIQDCFWYEKLYDRYIHRYYEVIPTSQIVNVPANVKRVLDDRWKFILVESGRGKELTSAVKSCKRCSGYCASNNSVDCGVCHQTYHMNCINPPLLKKPSRGFAWSCGPCSRAQERKLEARNTPNIAGIESNGEDEEQVDEEDEDVMTPGDDVDAGSTSPAVSVDAITSVHPETPEQIHQANMWPFRYLGVHCKVEDALDYDDRIYPRASSRLGPRHQAEVTPWPGRPFTLVKPAEIKRKYARGGNHRKDAKLLKESIATIDADRFEREKRPKWVVDEPPGYIPRGEDFDNDDSRNTSQLLYKPPELASTLESSKASCSIEDYMRRAKDLAEPIGVKPYFANFLDKAVNLLYLNNFDIEKSMRDLSEVEKKDLKEPELTPAEQKRFEDGVTRYGSEWHSIKKHVKTVSAANIVRYYYIWKKSDRGKQVWGNYSGRKGKREVKKAEAVAGKLQDDVADAQDDSAFDNDKIAAKKREFQCKFCSVRTSPQWRRAPNTATGALVPLDPSIKSTGKDKSTQPMIALCLLCAVVWRKYAVQREDTDDHKKSIASKSKRKFDDSFREFQANDLGYTVHNIDVAGTPTGGTPNPPATAVAVIQEPVRKKPKGSDKEHVEKKAAEKAAGPSTMPEMPKPKILPCSICLQMEPLGDQHISCKECRMTVHRNCYGVVGENRTSSKWVCDMCSNDRNPQVSVQYKCMLCSIEYTEQDFIEPPKASHKKRTERDREKDRVDRELAEKNAEYFRKKQADLNRPLNPREPLKRTANNNWVHVTCAVWTPEVKFGNAKALEPSEGIASIPSPRLCETCKVCNLQVGACIACHCCHLPVHIECAHQQGFILGFDITPVKGSRRDQVKIVDINGEAGTMSALIWCKDHAPTKTIVHRMYDVVDDAGLNALQLYVQNFKQADLTLSGTVRKANLINQSTKVANPAVAPIQTNRRTSTATIGSIGRGSVSNFKLEESSSAGALAEPASTLVNTSLGCVTCGVNMTPKWWPYPPKSSPVAAPSTLLDNEVTTLGSGTRDLESNHLVLNGPPHLATTPVALAAAALSEDSPVLSSVSTDVQCHKCHFRKLRKVDISSPQVKAQSTSGGISSVPGPSAAPPAPIASPASLQTTARYSWSHAPVYSPPRSFSAWPQGSPVPSPSNSSANIYNNGTHSPRAVGTGHHLMGQTQTQQISVSVPHSPLPNGINHQVLNGYARSPHRSLPGSGHAVQNGSPYPSYNATRLPPQHLINGGPPPRASESPFFQNTHTPMPSRQYGQPQVSPSVRRETPPTNRDLSGRNHNAMSADGRVHGGASASPSLHNLLS